MRVKIGLMGIACAIVLTGCKTDLTKISDAQLLNLVGSGTPFLSLEANTKERPIQISPRMIECFAFLSNTKTEIYKDFPAEMLGVAKTECRSHLVELLGDNERNTTNLVLEDFERADLAERFFKIGKSQSQKLEAYKIEKAKQRKIQREKDKAERAAAKEAKKAERIKEMQTKVRLIRAEAPKLKTTLNASTDEHSKICEKHRELRRALQKIKAAKHVLIKHPPNICVSKKPFVMQLLQIKTVEKQLSKIEEPIDGKSQVYLSNLPKVDLIKFKSELAEVKDIIEIYEAELLKY